MRFDRLLAVGLSFSALAASCVEHVGVQPHGTTTPPSSEAELSVGLVRLKERLTELASAPQPDGLHTMRGDAYELIVDWGRQLNGALFDVSRESVPNANGSALLSLSAHDSLSLAQTRRIARMREYFEGVQFWIDIFQPTIEDLGAVRSDFWAAVYSNISSDVAHGIGGEAALIRRLEASRDALLALFGPSAPLLDQTYFIWLVGDALEAFVQRLDSVTPYVDTASRYLGDVGESHESTPVANAWRVLSQLDNPDGMVETTGLGDWTIVYETMAADHDRLIDSLRFLARDPRVGYQRSDILFRRPLPRQYHEVLSVLVAANDRWTRFQNTGLFLEEPTRGIKNNLLAASRSAIALDVEDKTDTLSLELATYDSNVADLIGSLATASGYRSAETKFAAAITSKEMELDTLVSRRDALVQQLASTDQHIEEDIERRFQPLAAQGGHLKVKHETQMNVNARHASFDRDAHGKTYDDWTIEDVAVMGPFHVSAGGILSVSVPQGDTWEPICALARDYPQLPVGPTGPEGYTLVVRYGQTRVRSVTSSSGQQEGGTGHSTSQSQHSSSEAVARSGILSDQAPFRDAPVGSLALVSYVDHEETSLRLRDRVTTEVVTAPRFTAVPQFKAKYYLVVNDATCPAASTNALGVNVSQWIPREEVAGGVVGKRLTEKIAEAVTRIRNERIAAMLAGELSPERRSVLQAETMWDVASDPVIGGLVFDDDVEGVFNLFVSREIERIALAASIFSLGRQIDERRFSLQALSSQLDDAREAVALQDMLVEKARSRIHRGALETAALESARLFRDGFASIVDVWYPDIRSFFSYRPTATHLLNVGFQQELSEIALDTKLLMEDVIAKYKTRIRETSMDQWDRAVMIAIPRPETATMLEGPMLGSAESASFWDALEGGTEAIIEIDEDILYTSATQKHQLSCSDSYPVVHRIALAMVTNWNERLLALNGAEVIEEATVSDGQMVVASHQPMRVHFLDASRLTFPVGVVFAGADGEVRQLINDLARSFPARLGNRVIGVSPVGQLHFDFRRRDSWGWRSTAMPPSQWASDYVGAYLVMLVETDAQHRNVSWIPDCTNVD